MLRLLLLSVLAFSLLVPPVSAQTPEAAKRFTYVTGTALDLVPDGKPGIIDIIPVGPYGPRGIPVVVWNHTARTVTDLHVFGMIRTAEGQLLAAWQVQVFPDVIPIGTFAFTMVAFAGQMPDEPAPDDVITFEAYVPNAASDPNFPAFTIVPLQVEEAVRQGSEIVGMIRNTTGRPVDRVMGVALCFDGSGQAIGDAYDVYDDIRPALPHGAGHRFALPVAEPCARFLIAFQTTFYDLMSVG
jgi:hypothetical protein